MAASAPSKEKIQIEGEITRVLYHADDTGYCICKANAHPKATSEKNAKPITLLGRLALIQAGERFTATGRWQEHPEHGWQFQSDTLQTSPPLTDQGLQRYLGSGLIDGIGPHYAQKIVDRFGKDTLRIIDTQSKKLETIEGIGKKRRLEIKASWEQQKHLHTIMLFLHSHGLSTAKATRIHQHYGDQAIAAIQADPYALIQDIHGIGFVQADRIAESIGLEKGSPARLRAALLHSITLATSQGHACLPRETLLAHAAKLLETEPSSELSDQLNHQLTESIDLLLQKKHLIAHPNGDLYPPELHHAEQDIATHLQRLQSASLGTTPIDADAAIPWAQKKLQLSLHPEQQDALTHLLQHKVALLCGGPGVGKTTLLSFLLRIHQAKGHRILLAAPTGRAAQRMATSCAHPATTLHRLLEAQPQNHKQPWGRHPERPLEADLLILDESSMIDLPLMSALLTACPDSLQLLLVGDPDQIPSVGPGKVLLDFLQSGKVPTLTLTQVHRQAENSAIITAAHRIKHGELPNLKNPNKDKNKNKSQSRDLYHLSSEEPESIQATLHSLVTRRLPERYPLHPIRDLQILTPVHRGPLGVRALNDLLQHSLNPPDPLKPELTRLGRTLRQGDRVIQTRNHPDKQLSNGDIGFVTSISSDKLTVHYPDKATEHSDISYRPNDLDDLDLAYAITIHKSQGSEFAYTILLCHTSHHLMLNRNLYYTGLTRAKKLCVLLGQEEALKRAVQNTTAHQRHGHLLEALREER